MLWLELDYGSKATREQFVVRYEDFKRKPWLYKNVDLSTRQQGGIWRKAQETYSICYFILIHCSMRSWFSFFLQNVNCLINIGGINIGIHNELKQLPCVQSGNACPSEKCIHVLWVFSEKVQSSRMIKIDSLANIYEKQLTLQIDQILSCGNRLCVDISHLSGNLAYAYSTMWNKHA